MFTSAAIIYRNTDTTTGGDRGDQPRESRERVQDEMVRIDWSRHSMAEDSPVTNLEDPSHCLFEIFPTIRVPLPPVSHPYHLLNSSVCSLTNSLPPRPWLLFPSRKSPTDQSSFLHKSSPWSIKRLLTGLKRLDKGSAPCLVLRLVLSLSQRDLFFLVLCLFLFFL